MIFPEAKIFPSSPFYCVFEHKFQELLLSSSQIRAELWLKIHSCMPCIAAGLASTSIGSLATMLPHIDDMSNYYHDNLVMI